MSSGSYEVPCSYMKLGQSPATTGIVPSRNLSTNLIYATVSYQYMHICSRKLTKDHHEAAGSICGGKGAGIRVDD